MLRRLTGPLLPALAFAILYETARGTEGAPGLDKADASTFAVPGR